MKKKRVVWPKTVPVVTRVGVGQDFYANGKPCCARGWARRVFKVGVTDYQHRRNNFDRAYREVAGIHYGYGRAASWWVTEINDKAKPVVRVLLFNAAMARLGYYRGQPKNAKELADKAAKVLGKFKFAR